MWKRFMSIVGLTLTAMLVTRSAAEVPSRTPEALRLAATHIVTGQVMRIYDRSYSHGNGAEIRYVAEVRVKSVDAGHGINSGSLIYVRYFTQEHPAGTTAASGHRGLPQEGDTVRIFLAQNAKDLSGEVNEDGGLNVLFPNGFEQLTNENAK
jgi:hypothetical protein